MKRNQTQTRAMLRTRHTPRRLPPDRPSQREPGIQLLRNSRGCEECGALIRAGEPAHVEEVGGRRMPSLFVTHPDHAVCDQVWADRLAAMPASCRPARPHPVS